MNYGKNVIIVQKKNKKRALNRGKRIMLNGDDEREKARRYWNYMERRHKGERKKK